MKHVWEEWVEGPLEPDDLQLKLFSIITQVLNFPFLYLAVVLPYLTHTQNKLFVSS